MPQSSCRRSSMGKIVGQRSPDTAIAVAVEDGINHGSHLGLAWPPTGAGRQEGFRTAHCWLVRSLGYGFGFIPFLRSRPPFWNRLSVAGMRRVQRLAGSEQVKTEVFHQVGRERPVRGEPVPSLTPTFQMVPQPLHHITVELVELLTGIAVAKSSHPIRSETG